MPTREVTSFPLIKIIYVVTKAVHIDGRNFRGKKKVKRKWVGMRSINLKSISFSP